MFRYRNHNTYGGPGPGDNMHRPMIGGADGMKHSLVGYTESLMTYEAKGEEVIEYTQFPVIVNNRHSPPEKDLYKVREVVDKPLLVPRGSAHDRPEANKFSQTFPREPIHDQHRGSPNRVHNPPINELYKDHGVVDKPLHAPWGSTHGHPEKVDRFSPDFHRQPVHGQGMNSPNRDYSPPRKELYKEHGVVNKPSAPWGLTRDLPEKAHVYSPKFHRGPIHGQDENLPNRDYSPPRKELSKEHRVADKPPAPWGSTRDQQNGSSPKFSRGPIHGQEKNLPKRDYSPPRKEPYNDHRVVDNPLLAPLRSTRDHPEKDDGFSPKFHREPTYGQDNGSPRRDYSPPPRNQQHMARDYGKQNYLDKDDRASRDNQGNSYPLSSYNVPSSNQPRKHNYYESSLDNDNNEKDKAKFLAPNHTAPAYTVPSSNQPKKDIYYETPATTYNNDKHKASTGYYPPYTVPATTQPRNDTYYDTSNNRPMAPNPPPIKTRADRGRGEDYYNENGKSSPIHNATQQPQYNSPVRNNQGYQETRPMAPNPPPIKTRAERGRVEDYYNENGKSSPVHNATQQPQYGSPVRNNQGYQETIDSTEARKRYGKGPARPGTYAEEYRGVIDAREAARKYNGVLLSN